MHFKRTTQIHHVPGPHARSGQLLIEMMLAIAAAVIVLSLGAQLVYVSLRSNQAAGDRNVGLGLAEEGIEGVRSATAQQWQSLYALAKNGTHYHPLIAAGAWTIAAGDDSVTINGASYERFFVVANVCRDSATRSIAGITDADGSTMLCTASGGTFDPSTQRVIVTVSLQSGDPLTVTEYMVRWRNKVCAQADWSSSGSGVKNCPDATYESKSNITAGATLQLTPQ